MRLLVILHYASPLILYSILGSESVGIFAAAFRFRRPVILFPALLGSIFPPRLARVIVEQPERAGREASSFCGRSSTGCRLSRCRCDGLGSTGNRRRSSTRLTPGGSLVRIFSVAVVFNFAILQLH